MNRPDCPENVNARIPHQEVEIRVKEMVDEGVAELVRGLNGFPALFTTNSCQGDPGECAMVCCRYEGSPREALAFALWLSDQFGMRRQDNIGISVACNSHFNVHLRFNISPDAVPLIASELRSMAYMFASEDLETSLSKTDGHFP